MSKAEFGMVGLGTMGRNFLLNVAENGFAAAGYDIDPAKCRLLDDEASTLALRSFDSLSGFMAALQRPRKIMLLVPAGKVVDSVIEDFLPHLAEGDLVIDGGNSHFMDTERRGVEMGSQGIGFLGVGVSGGEEGARHGPSIMAGGEPKNYELVRTIFEAAAAKVDGEPCAALVGRGSAGHFVKMTHNGIEYAMMQLIAEAYDLMKRGFHMATGEIGDVFGKWNEGQLNSFLIEITSFVLKKIDPETGKPLVEMILDTAGQKGTGRWTSQAAMDLGVPIPSIDSAVTMRQISSRKTLRTKLASGPLKKDGRAAEGRLTIGEIEDALYACFITAYAQGFSLMKAASAERNYEIDLSKTATIWRGGCIIRSLLLGSIRSAFEKDPSIEDLLLDDEISAALITKVDALRKTAIYFTDTGVPSMCFAASLNYLDSVRTERLPANLIQAQRDHFGAHTYHRTDRDGIFHTNDWEM